MAVVDFSPSFQGGSGYSSLSVSISPLGLVEMSDEEFEVHGLRMQRYAYNWNFFIGNHWSIRREVGEDQLTFNWVRAMANHIRRFVFGQGVVFRSPKATEAIVPRILERVWQRDNNQEIVLDEMAQQGGVSGDCFVKLAYEPAWVTPVGDVVPGKVRILPLNSAHCFPTYHAHDKRRLTEFKLKYKTWATATDGTRQVMTYTEHINDLEIVEYWNDQIFSRRPNPLGFIPVVHIANQEVSGTPWGLSDVGDIINLNRVYNEHATSHADVINYNANPVTIVTGAKPGALEKGARKQWTFPDGNTKVYNLEMTGNQAVVVAFLQDLKVAMHELACVPIGALGNTQPISNTSGVALAIEHMPLMMLRDEHVRTYGAGLERINEIILRYVLLYEPNEFYFRPTEGQPELKDGQVASLDPYDPETFRTVVHFNSPFPVDKLALLNELATKMQMGLESKRGALRELGEEYPDEKLYELEQEAFEEAERAGILQLKTAMIQAVIRELTGVDVTGGQVADPAQPRADANGNPILPVGPPPLVQQIAASLAPQAAGLETSAEVEEFRRLVVGAFGTKLATRTPPALTA